MPEPLHLLVIYNSMDSKGVWYPIEQQSIQTNPSQHSWHSDQPIYSQQDISNQNPEKILHSINHSGQYIIVAIVEQKISVHVAWNIITCTKDACGSVVVHVYTL